MLSAAMMSQLFNGLSTASILLMMAIGLAVIFGLMRVINMAHGELMTAGAYMAYVSPKILLAIGGPALVPWSYALALPLAFIAGAALGWLIEWAVVRHLYGRVLETLLATWGISLVLQQVFRDVFGSNNVTVNTPQWLQGGLSVTANVQLPWVRLFILFLLGVSLLATWLFLYRSRLGMQIRSVMQNRSMSSCCGIATRRIDAITFAFGSGLAGLAGCGLALLGPIGPSTGQHYIVDAFMVVVLGGVGQLAGAVCGAFAIGELQSFFEYMTSATAAKVIIFTLIIVFLQLRPAGFFPSRSRVLD